MPIKVTNESFQAKANEIHKDKYTYHNDYVSAHTKIRITCPIHGDFMQTPNSHLNGNGCPKCAIESSAEAKSIGLDEFKKRAEEVHKGKYIYTEIKEYKNCETKVPIICPIHGIFWQTPRDHLRGRGCRKCGTRASHDKAMKSAEQFIEDARKVHGDKYIYRDLMYRGNKKPVNITCKIHGVFWQVPIYHLRGSGCPLCQRSTLEEEVAEFLLKNNISFDSQYTFRELFVNEHNTQHLDFFLPQYNIGIECQGIQHFKPTDFAGKGTEWAKKQFLRVQEMDKRKKLICEEKGIPILYFAKEKYNDEIITDTNILLERIKEHDKLRTDAT